MKDEKPGKLPETTTNQDNPVPTATPTTESRRRLLKRLATGGGVVAAGGMLPQKWTSPVVQSVLLPAHAAGSPGGGNGGPSDEQCDDVSCGEITVTNWQRRDPPAAAADITGTDLDDLTGGCDGLLVTDNTKMRFVVNGIPPNIKWARAYMTPSGGSSQNSPRCVPVSAGGVAEWNTTGTEISTAQSSDGCNHIVVQFSCTAPGSCGDFVETGGECIIGYVDVTD